MAAYVEEALSPQVVGAGGQFQITRGPAIASAATISPTYRITHVTGTATITTISVPWPGFTGQLVLVPDGAFKLGTGGNINSAVSATVGVPLYLEFDGSSWFLAASQSGNVNFFAPWSEGYGSIAASVVGIGTLDITPLRMPGYASFNSVYVGLSQSWSATNAGSSNGQSLQISFGVWTKTGGSLSLASSGAQTTAFTVTGSSSSASYQGLKLMPVPINLIMTPGNYWFGYIYSSSSAAAGAAIMGVYSNALVSYPGAESAYLGVFGSSSFASDAPIVGKGQLSVCTAALPAVIAFSDMITAGQTGQPVVNFMNFTAS